MNKTRCAWVAQNPLYIAYHDQEWGKPIYNSQMLFEVLLLEGAQAGLSWLTILKKRDHYRRVFDYFDPHKIASYDQNKITALLADPGIVRNRLKVQAFIINARQYLNMERQGTCFADFLWSFVGGQPVINHWSDLVEVPTVTAEAESMSTALKKRGFKFVGPTICYAFMQAVGMVNDHTTDCWSHSGG